MDLIYIFNIFKKRIWVLLSIPIAIGVLTYFLTDQLPPKYKSTAQLATGFTTNDKIQVVEERLNLREASVKFSNLIETINSELVLSLLSYKLLIHDLESDSAFRNAPQDGFLYTLDPYELDESLKVVKERYKSLEPLSPYEEADAKILNLLTDRNYSGWQLKDDIRVFRVRDTDFVKIQFISENPFLSAFVVNTLGEEYIRYENSLRSDFSGESVQFFAKQMNDKKGIRDEKRQIYDDFLRRNGLLTSDDESGARLNQVNEYELLEQEARSEVQRLTLSLDDVNLRIANYAQSGDRSAINRKIVQIREKINELTRIYRESGSSDSTMANAISDLRLELQKQIDRLESSNGVETATRSLQDLKDERSDLNLELRIANQNLSSIQSNLRRLRSNVAGYAANEANLQSLKRDLDKAIDDFNAAEERYNKELDKSKISETSVRMVIEGQPNGSPESSKRLLIVLMSAVASFAFCSFVMLAIEFLDMRMRTPDQFKKMTGLELAGVIPNVPAAKLDLVTLFNSKNQKGDKDTFRHFLRKLRYELEKDASQVYLFTSNKQLEGKSFIVMCLAFTLSLLKKKVLIIDTNFKNNSLTRALMPNMGQKRIENHQFLLSSGEEMEVDDEVEEEKFANSIVSGTAHKQIYIIGNTGDQASPSEIFAGRDFRSMIHELKGHYDYIFMEGPALNDFSDTQELVDYAEKIIPLFSSDSMIKAIDRESISYLKALNGQLMGAILNKVELDNIKI